ncbi:hypothetical protein DID88_006356 [Monilinia fructigena]|uniref:Uncharacterized protein n=1 Tax=Monilinia fructigena TaxID=38457 RepID=A0A395J3K9_9HELO|nr:hypothetical protein DID88_006356 [Monilinia fructigena]
MAPTPESAAFLAKKPTVPPTFDGVDYDDTARLKQAQDARGIGKVLLQGGVNHLEKCGALRDRYFELLKESKIRGYLFEQQNYTKKPE